MRDGLFVENPAGMREAIYSPTGPVGRHMIVVGRAIQEAAKQQVGVDTEFLRDHIVIKSNIGEAGPEIEVGSDAVRHDLDHSYALYHHEGHPDIDSDTLMVFKIGNNWVSTHHIKAVAPNRYLKDPMDAIVNGEITGGLASRLAPGLPL